MNEGDLLSSVAAVFGTSQEKQEDCKNGLLFLERMAASGYEEPARIIIDFLRPVDMMEGAWVLTTAVALGLGNAFRLLTKAGANLRLHNNRGYSPFHMAVKKNKPELVKVLLEAGLVSPEEPTRCDTTPLILAAKIGSAGCVRVLLENGALVNVNSDIETPLHYSVYRGSSECLQLLLAQEGVELDRESESILTPLMYAVEMEHVECVKMLLSAGANVKEKNRGAAHMAAFRNRADILKLLIEAGAPLEGGYGADDSIAFMTPLHVASCVHALDCLQLLVDLGGDVNVRAEDRATPLHLSVGSKGEQWSRVLSLPYIDDELWDNIVSGREFQSMQLDCVRALVAGGANVNAIDKNSLSPLHMCAYGGNPECLKILLDAGANTNSACNNGRTALHYSVKLLNTERLKILLKAGASVHHKDNKGKTALHIAAKFRTTYFIRKCLECMRMLINAGSDLEATTSHGQRPLDILMETGHNRKYNWESCNDEIFKECLNLLEGNWNDYCNLYKCQPGET